LALKFDVVAAVKLLLRWVSDSEALSGRETCDALFLRLF
jgi:hypothetical protein